MEKKRIWHILPENDNTSHLPISEIKIIIDNDGNICHQVECSCECDPDVCYEENGNIIIVHQAADKRVNAYFKDSSNDLEDEKKEILIGYLTRKLGLKGYKMAIPGHHVFDAGDRYVIYLESENIGQTKRITYYKDSLKGWIDFIKK